ncbi:hypothetical protein [Acetobacter orientalis]|uniref:hypothetical protein n=2 Tax=Acetobacter TaxID=434 RepID=UPI0039E7B471
MKWKNFISSMIGGLVSGGIITAISSLYITKYQNELSNSSWTNQHSVEKTEKFFDKKVDILSEYVAAISETLDVDASSEMFAKKEVLKNIIVANNVKFNTTNLDQVGLPNAKDIMSEHFSSNEKLKKSTDLIRLYYGNDIFMIAKDVLNKLYNYGNPEFDPQVILELDKKVKALKEKRQNSLQDFVVALKEYLSIKGYPPEIIKEIDIVESKMMESIKGDMKSNS